jgi:hypothetical protein
MELSVVSTRTLPAAENEIKHDDPLSLGLAQNNYTYNRLEEDDSRTFGDSE